MNNSFSRIFGLADSAEDVIYINWLSMALSSLFALEFYSPSAQEWKQAHSQARFAILQVKAIISCLKFNRFRMSDAV